MKKQNMRCVLLIFLTGLKDGVGCPDNWIHFHGNCYSFMTTRMNWFRATKACKDHHSVLVDLQSKDEDDFLKGTIQRQHAHDDPETIGYWTSANDLEVEGQWVWGYPSEIAVTYTDWSVGEPNNRAASDGREEDCVVLWGHDSYGYKWNDQPCDYKDYFICKRKDTDIVVG